MSAEVERARVRPASISIASGATRSSSLNISGYSGGSVIIPSGFKGTIRYRARNASTGSSGRFYDEAATSPAQAVGALTKPLVMALHPKVMAACRIINICSSSAMTAPKTLDVFLKF